MGRLPPREKLALSGLGAIALMVFGCVGAEYLRRPQEVHIEPLKVANSAQGGSQVVVHVAGAVVKPGLYTLPPGARVHDAIKAAGGAADGADLQQLNLAERIADGVKLTVPLEGETLLQPLVSAAPQTSYTPQPTSSVTGGLVNLNTAGLAELDTLPGVGPATARKILEFRNAHGGFRTINDLELVSGIGPKKLEQIRPFVRL